MATVVEISDNEDNDDCVINSVTFIVDDEPDFDLPDLEYVKELSKENKLLADFIVKCLRLENSNGMQKILKENLLKHYYAADRTITESPKFQKNLRRANNLLKTYPGEKFTHIKDLCNILKAAKFKKRVPFVTLSNNLTDKNCEPANKRKRINAEQLNVTNSTSKIAKFDRNKQAPFPETVSNVFNDASNLTVVNDESINMEICYQQSKTEEYNHTSNMIDASVTLDSCPQEGKATEEYNDTNIVIDENIIMETSCQQSEVTEAPSDMSQVIDENIIMETSFQQCEETEENKLLIPRKEVPTTIVPTPVEKRLKIIENKISYCRRKIAELDEQEVDDDSLDSPYIKSERLKSKIILLYKERCQLLGNQSVKCKRIRLKLAHGHPPGPTKALERFLNTNCNKYGDPPFPDFCDVITCVTEANDKDGLGWTKAQIMNEASSLFTLCGRALQKRRQNREYQDLVSKVKLEDLEKDPAENDPELKAKLEQNKRIAVKKESDILERYTMMQYMPTKSKLQKKSPTIKTTENEVNNETIIKSCPDHDAINNSNGQSSGLNIDKTKKSNDSAPPETYNGIKSASNHNLNEESLKGENSLQGSNGVNLDMDVDSEKTDPVSTLPYNVNTKIDEIGNSSDVKDSRKKTVCTKLIRNSTCDVSKSFSKVEAKSCVQSKIVNKDTGLELEANNLNVNNNQEKPIDQQSSDVIDSGKKKVDLKLIRNRTGHVSKSFSKVETKSSAQSRIVNKEKGLETNNSNVINDQSQEKPIDGQSTNLKDSKSQEKPIDGHSTNFKDSNNKDICTKLITNGTSHVSKSFKKVETKSRIVTKDKSLETNNSNVINIQSQTKPNDDESKSNINTNVMEMFNKLGNNFTVTIEIMNGDN